VYRLISSFLENWTSFYANHAVARTLIGFFHIGGFGHRRRLRHFSGSHDVAGCTEGSTGADCATGSPAQHALHCLDKSCRRCRKRVAIVRGRYRNLPSLRIFLAQDEFDCRLIGQRRFARSS